MSDLVTLKCCTCGTAFGVEPEVEYYSRLAETTFYCPLGHGQVFLRKSNEAPKKQKRQSATILKLIPPDDAA